MNEVDESVGEAAVENDEEDVVSLVDSFFFFIRFLFFLF